MRPLFLLGAHPVLKVALRDFFHGGADSAMELLRNPGQTRLSGWDLRTYDEPRIVEATYLEVGKPDYKLIRLYRDGTLLLRGAGNDDLLAWATRRFRVSGCARVNTVVLAELTYHFVLFYSQLLDRFESEPREVQLSIGLKHAISESGDSQLCIVPAAVDTYEWEFPLLGVHKAPRADMAAEFVVSASDVRGCPEAVAYRLVEAFYVLFGVSADKIPYVAIVNGQRRTDIAKIRALG